MLTDVSGEFSLSLHRFLGWQKCLSVTDSSLAFAHIVNPSVGLWQFAQPGRFELNRACLYRSFHVSCGAVFESMHSSVSASLGMAVVSCQLSASALISLATGFRASALVSNAVTLNLLETYKFGISLLWPLSPDDASLTGREGPSKVAVEQPTPHLITFCGARRSVRLLFNLTIHLCLLLFHSFSYAST